MSYTRGTLQYIACGLGKAAQLSRHEVEDVVGEAPHENLRHVPAPLRGGAIELEKPFLIQRGQELIREKRIPAGLFEKEAGERSGPLRAAVERVGDDSTEAVGVERSEDDQGR